MPCSSCRKAMRYPLRENAKLLRSCEPVSRCGTLATGGLGVGSSNLPAPTNEIRHSHNRHATEKVSAERQWSTCTSPNAAVPMCQTVRSWSMRDHGRSRTARAGKPPHDREGLSRPIRTSWSRGSLTEALDQSPADNNRFLSQGATSFGDPALFASLTRPPDCQMV